MRPASCKKNPSRTNPDKFLIPRGGEYFNVKVKEVNIGGQKSSVPGGVVSRSRGILKDTIAEGEEFRNKKSPDHDQAQDLEALFLLWR
jgi:hypothetical protein